MITWYCPDCPFSVGSRSGLTVRDAKNEHEKTCVPHNSGQQLFKGETTMSGYIPTEDEVETAFSTFAAELAIEFPSEYPEAPEFATIKGASAGFYRYLNQVKADAWDHAIEHVSQLEADVGFMEHYKPHNPYRKQEEA